MKRGWIRLACVAACACMALTGCSLQPTDAPVSSQTTPSTELTALPGLPALERELLELQVLGDRLLLQNSTPGLDTCDTAVVLYDLQRQKTLCQVELGVDDWQVGLTQDGFYAVSLTRQAVRLYNADGQLQEGINFSGQAGVWSLAAVSPDGRYLLYGDGRAAAIMLYTIADKTTRQVGKLNGYMAALPHTNGRFYLRTDSELLYLDQIEGIIYSAFVDRRVNFVTPYYGIGTTDTNFLAIAAADGKPRYIPYTAVDEEPLAAGERGFVTGLTNQQGDRLRFYDLQAATMREVSVPQTVRGVCCAGDGQLLIAARQEGQPAHRVYLWTGGDTQPLQILSADHAVQTQTQPSIDTQAPPPGSTGLLDTVPVIAQFPAFPTGCESVSAVMLLRHAGYTVSVEDFVDKYLPKSADFYYENGVKYGPDPAEYFLGNPRSTASYGCMAPVIVRALGQVPGMTHRVVDATGSTLDELCTRYIDAGVPVAVWATIGMIETHPGSTWHLPGGSEYAWPVNEHCLVLVGYDESSYFFNDPYAGKRVAYAKARCRQRYEQLGMQAVALVKK